MEASSSVVEVSGVDGVRRSVDSCGLENNGRKIYWTKFNFTYVGVGEQPKHGIPFCVGVGGGTGEASRAPY